MNRGEPIFRWNKHIYMPVGIGGLTYYNEATYRDFGADKGKIDGVRTVVEEKKDNEKTVNSDISLRFRRNMNKNS